MPHTTGIERKVQRPRWAGESLAGRTLLVHDEQGFGNTFQFMRLLPLVKQRSQARVVFDVNPQTLSLARRGLPEIDAVIASDALPPPFDVHCELMSLPMALGLTLADLPGRIPYLVPEPARLARRRTRLADLPRSLGRPAWVMLPFAPDWRWLMHRTDTPWYPRHRLFRQPQRHRWEPLIHEVAGTLAALRDSGRHGR